MSYKGKLLIVPKVLRPWLWTVVWLLLMLISFSALLMLNDLRSQKEFITKSETAVNSRVNVPGTSPVFVAIGDSLLYYSLPSETDFGIELNSALGGNVHWLRYWLTGSVLKPFLPIINIQDSDFNGTYFFLQDSIFQQQNRTLLRYRIEALKNSMLAFMRADNPSWGNVFIGYHLDNTYVCAALRKDLIEGADQRYLAMFSINGNIIQDESLDYIRMLKKKAKRVLVFSLPRTQSNIKEAFQEAWRKKLAFELKREGIKYVQIGPSMPDDHYCDDKSHPNDKGRMIRTQQFINFVKQVSTSTP